MRIAACFLLTLAVGLSTARAADWPMPTFPVRVAPDHRHLEDQTGAPFLIQGDAAWSLIAELDPADTDHYLAARRAQGFNTLLISLIEHKFATNAPANAAGIEPFLSGKAFTQPNPAYFAAAHAALARAQSEGFLVLLTPAYLGINGGDEGWYAAMEGAGPGVPRAYGQFVGQTFKDLSNIIWVMGGDFDPPDKSLVRALVEGISSADPTALFTFHGGPGNSPALFWVGDDWLDIDTVYSYDPVFPPMAEATAAPDPRPVVMIESTYEGEHGADAMTVRAIAYGAMLGGAAGHVYGHGAVWHFSGPGVVAIDEDWRSALASPGAASMTHLRHLLDGLRWWMLRANRNELVIGDSTAVAGRAADGSFALVYLSGVQSIALDLAGLGDGPIAAQWFDPGDGTITPVTGSPFAVASKPVVTPPDSVNGTGATDWVLILKSAAANANSPSKGVASSSEPP